MIKSLIYSQNNPTVTVGTIILNCDEKSLEYMCTYIDQTCSPVPRSILVWYCLLHMYM